VARVLFIEDDPSLRSVLSRLLSEAGHDVLDTGDAEGALELVGIYGADVVITDVMVSGQDGIALLADIRLAYPQLPLIAISGLRREEVDERLEESRLRAGVWFLAKPFQWQTLLATVEAALSA
jgi:DNA-binding response OmpR family regulator